MALARRRSGSRASRLLFAVSIALKVVASLLVYAMPLLGFWLASSLAAYRGGATWVPLVAGLVAFPVAPLAWDMVSEDRRKRRGDTRERFLTFSDRILLRTFAITFTLTGALLVARAELAFTALSTRGDWMLEGRHGAISERVRRALFATAQGLEWLYELSHRNQFEELVEDDGAHGEEHDRGQAGSGTQGSAGSTGKKPTPVPSSQPIDDKPKEQANASGPIAWPAAGTLHPIVTNMPTGSEDSYESVARYVREREPDPYQRIKALHDWLADRIAYDAEALADNKIPSQDARSVFASKKSVCAGYANLLNAMAKITGDEVEVVVGDARRDVDEVGGLGHAWNAVKIDDKWFLLDATWDAGHVSDRTFTKRYRTDYLFTPPEVFGIDHFPDSERWQLRDRPLTRGDFMRQPMLEAEFFARGLRLEAPDRSQVTVSGALEIRLDNPRGQFMLASFLPKGVTSGERTRCEVRPGPRIDVGCTFPSDGVFRVLLFAGAERFGSYEHVGTIEAVHRG